MLRSIMLALAGNPTITDVVSRNRFSRQLAKRFVAGDTLDEAVPIVRDLNARGFKVTLDALGENVGDEQAARDAAATYAAILDRIAAEGIDSTISVKLTMLGLDLSDDLTMDNMRTILDRAREHGSFVRIDMEGSAYTQRTLDIFYTLHETYGDHVGIVLQSYLYRTDRDVAEAVERRARVRLVKGAYAEPETVAYADKRDVNAAYRRHLELLLDAGTYPAIATHDDALIRVATGYALRMGIGRERFEFQMLYGVRPDLQRRFVVLAYGLGVYGPCGPEGCPCFTRRMAERPANLVFGLRSIVGR